MEQIDLLKELGSGSSYRHAVLCTYRFEADFFEQYLLRHARALRECDTITVAVDALEYQSLCQSKGDRIEGINRLYCCQDVEAARVFHPKLYLLTAPTRGKLLIGSANLTEPGLTSNAELVSAFTFDQSQDRMAQYVFHEAYAFLKLIAERVPGSTFASNVTQLAIDSPWLESGRQSIKAHVVHNSTKSLLQQMIDALGSKRVDEYLVVSPDFDKKLAVLHEIADRLKPKRVTIVTQDGSSSLPLNELTDWCERHRGIQLQVYLVEFSKEKRYRTMHAKLHVLRNNRRRVCLSGSPNCTSAAMLSTWDKGNIEAGILFETDADVVRALLASPSVQLHRTNALDRIKVRLPDYQSRCSFPVFLVT